MTAYSAKVDENNAVFDIFQPGGLAEVFGIRIAGFDRARAHIEREGEKTKTRTFHVRKTASGSEAEQICYEAAYWEEIELRTAQSYAHYEDNTDACAVSVNQYGKGMAFYVSAETSQELLDWLYGEIAKEEGLCTGIEAPLGVVVRKISDTETLTGVDYDQL